MVGPPFVYGYIAAFPRAHPPGPVPFGSLGYVRYYICQEKFFGSLWIALGARGFFDCDRDSRKRVLDCARRRRLLRTRAVRRRSDRWYLHRADAGGESGIRGHAGGGGGDGCRAAAA